MYFMKGQNYAILLILGNRLQFELVFCNHELNCVFKCSIFEITKTTPYEETSNLVSNTLRNNTIFTINPNAYV